MEKNQNLNPTPPSGVFADITCDTAFKVILGTERNKQCTINLLNRIITDHKIVDVTFKNTEIPSEDSESRKSVIDVLCTDDEGNQIIVEMQKSRQTHFRERIYFYTSKVIAATKGISGEWNYDLKPTYAISFLYFDKPLSWMKNRPFLHYVTKGENDDKMPGSAEFFLFDLKNFEKSGPGISPEMKKWLTLLRDAKLWKETPAHYQNDKEFEPYFTAARIAKFTPDEHEKYLEDMMTKWDIENSKREAVEEARAEGLAEGLAKGEAKGLAKGETKGKVEGKEEMVQSGYKAGLSVEVLSQISGFPINKIKAIIAI